ncbi:hypothetical protein BLA29_011628 [Euroglyphus maynei]|uniref:Uncharacterized protein n=1 Tax=Euroglyphus maynei TaxID=6958 RepID=A0A1Y3ASW6_EURMA|nr:hypothetical protein BLA29_011628 [Euroglyphus maynei]
MIESTKCTTIVLLGNVFNDDQIVTKFHSFLSFVVVVCPITFISSYPLHLYYLYYNLQQNI